MSSVIPHKLQQYNKVTNALWPSPKSTRPCFVTQIFDQTETSILFVKHFPWGCTEFPEFSIFVGIPEYSSFFRFVVPCPRIRAGIHDFCARVGVLNFLTLHSGSESHKNRISASLSTCWHNYCTCCKLVICEYINCVCLFVKTILRKSQRQNSVYRHV